MSGFSIPLSVVVTRRSLINVPRRDLLIAGSDTPVLSVTVYQAEGDPAPLDLFGASFLLNLFHDPDTRHGLHWDYGFFCDPQVRPVQQVSGTNVDEANGRVDFAISAARWTQRLVRLRYALVISYGTTPTSGIGILPPAGTVPAPNYAQGNMTILLGAMDFLRTPSVPLVQAPPLLGGIGIAST